MYASYSCNNVKEINLKDLIRNIKHLELMIENDASVIQQVIPKPLALQI